MGWFSKAFGGVGDVLEDAFSVEGITGGVTGLLIGGPIGGIAGMTLGGLQHHQNERAEEAQQAQIAAAQKLADMQDPSRVVQQATAAPQIQRQQQINEINAATEKSRKLQLSKMNYNTGLGGFSTFGSANTDKLG